MPVALCRKSPAAGFNSPEQSSEIDCAVGNGPHRSIYDRSDETDDGVPGSDDASL